ANISLGGAAGAGTAPARAPGAPMAQADGGYKRANQATQQARIVRGRAFYQNGNAWTDATAQSNQAVKQKNVKFNSDEYFALLRTNPDAAEWLALGSEVDVVIGDTLYSVREN